MTVVSFPIPERESSASHSSFVGMSRTGCRCRSVFQFQPTAPGICPVSYAVVSTSTSTRRTPESLRCSATHSVVTRTSGFAYSPATWGGVSASSVMHHLLYLSQKKYRPAVRADRCICLIEGANGSPSIARARQASSPPGNSTRIPDASTGSIDHSYGQYSTCEEQFTSKRLKAALVTVAPL